MKLRKFNDQGIRKFRENLDRIRSGEIDDLDKEILDNEYYTEIFQDDFELEPQIWESKSDLIQFIHHLIEQVDNKNVYYDKGLWTWLSAFFFDSVCPLKPDGTRKPGAIDRHILNPEDWRKYYRHLLAAPSRIYNELGSLSEIYLAGNSSTHGELFEQLASRQEIATNKGVIEAATLMYWDNDTCQIKKGARAKNGPGILRRFTGSVIPQFQLTYDLNSMTGKEIIELLPSEFDFWLSN